jgi:hypothetical protein
MHIHMHIHIHILCIYTYTYTYICIYIYTYTYHIPLTFKFKSSITYQCTQPPTKRTAEQPSEVKDPTLAKPPLDTDKQPAVSESFEGAVASMLHDVWRANRGMTSDGRYLSRVKRIGNEDYDIANLSFTDLPPFYKFENLLAAHAACESIRNEWLAQSRYVYVIQL